ncbi:MAG: hypothetical protein WCE36_03165 [Pseudolabrys sp.]
MESDDVAEAVKNRYPKGRPKGFLQSSFPEIYDTAAADGAVALALSQFRRYISPAFPENTASKTR